MRNIINYSTIIFSFALAASFLSSTLAIDLKLKNYNESLIGFSLSFFALGVIVSSFLHNIIREKYSLFFTLICSIFIQLLFFLLLFFQFSIFTIVIITFVMGFTNHINFLTIETYISSEFKNKSGFYISLFWSSAGFGAILGSLIIAFNGVNYLSYVIAILLIVFQFLPVFVSKSSILLTKVEKVEFSLSYNVINNIKFILICVFFLGISDAGWSSLFPSFLIEKGFADKDVGRINFTSGMLVLLIFQFSFTQEKIKVDGISSVVGDFIILDSDIDKVLIDMESQGLSTRGVSKCQLLGKLMEDKLYAHHAIQDSLELSDNEIYDYVDRQLEYFTEQLGGIDKVLEFYNKRDELSFRDELFEINKTQRLSEMMQESIVEKVEITPEEVRQFFQAIPKIDLPVFGTELEIAQIVVEPKVSEEENQRIVDQLKLFREDILEGGMSFASKALLYSQDPGSRSKGGKYTLNRKKPRMAKEFRDVAFSLREGEISQPFRTDFGWHIVAVDNVRGQEIDIRHILLIPKITDDELKSAKEKIDKIRERISSGEITFSDAALRFSDEKQTRLNGGVLINPSTNDTRFELTKMDPLLYSQVKDLNDNEMSMPLLDNSDNSVSKYKILKITNRFEEHVADFSQDYVKIKELALTEKQLKTIKKWMEEKIVDTYVNVNADSSYCNFAYNWKKE